MSFVVPGNRIAGIGAQSFAITAGHAATPLSIWRAAYELPKQFPYASKVFANMLYPFNGSSFGMLARFIEQSSALDGDKGSSLLVSPVYPNATPCAVKSHEHRSSCLPRQVIPAREPDWLAIIHSVRRVILRP